MTGTVRQQGSETLRQTVRPRDRAVRQCSQTGSDVEYPGAGVGATSKQHTLRMRSAVRVRISVAPGIIDTISSTWLGGLARIYQVCLKL